jgi:phosphomevalonate kinase
MFSLLGSLGKCSKTGLGSSSALIVACLKALLPNVSVELALKINFAAQQKVGSGFDIATCLKGSIIYKKPMY